MVAVLDHPPADDGAEKASGSVKPHALYNIGNNRSEPLMKVISLIEAACGQRPAICCACWKKFVSVDRGKAPGRGRQAPA